MKRDQILNAIKELGNSQGMYSRMYARLIDLKENNPEDYDMAMVHLEEQNFKDVVDLVMFLET